MFRQVHSCMHHWLAFLARTELIWGVRFTGISSVPASSSGRGTFSGRLVFLRRWLRAWDGGVAPHTLDFFHLETFVSQPETSTPEPES